LEIVELDFRTAVAYHFGRDYGAFGHTEPGSFFWRFNHAAWKERLHKEARRSREAFVLHFKAKYDEFPDLPVWVITEIMSFGALSKMCQGMMKVDQKKIAHRYGLQPDVWVSWLHHLTYVRNLCAHHARIWDRLWSIKPKLPRGEAWRPPSLPGNERLFTTLTILSALMRCCSPDAACSRGWWQHVKALVSQPPPVPNALDLMGFPADWDTHPLLK
jgi:abortive infection bacteriophage resistance protein